MTLQLLLPSLHPEASEWSNPRPGRYHDDGPGGVLGECEVHLLGVLDVARDVRPHRDRLQHSGGESCLGSASGRLVPHNSHHEAESPTSRGRGDAVPPRLDEAELAHQQGGVDVDGDKLLQSRANVLKISCEEIQFATFGA